MSDTLKSLREQHAKLVSEARSVLEKAEGPISGEDEARFDALMADADKIEGTIKREQEVREREQRVQAAVARKADERGESVATVEEREAQYADAFNRFMRGGMEFLKPEHREVMKSGFVGEEFRAQSLSGGSPVGIYGGYLVPQAFSNQLDVALKAFGPMLEVADVFETATGATLPWPTTNDTSNKGAILGENQPITEQDITFGTTSLSAYTYTSKLIRTSWQVMQDSAFDLDSLIANVAGERLGRILNEHFTTGTGSSQPQGFITGATSGATAEQQNAISYNDLVELQHSVDPAYRNNPKTQWMFNDATLKILRKLKDTTGRPLFWNDTGNLAAGVSPQLLGHSYRVNQDMASIGAASKSVAFGDFSKYKIRRVKGYALVRLNERYADQLQTGFFIYCRFDAKLINAGTNPLKYLTQKAASP